MKAGMAIGVWAYTLWGLSPLFWRIEGQLAPFDVTLWRAGTAMLLLLFWHAWRGSFSALKKLTAEPRELAKFGASGFLLSANWIVFIYVVNNERVLEASLGYFINPLMSVVLGVVVLRERLRLVSFVSVVIASVGVAVLTIEVGALPWSALCLAGTFALYGLLRKTSNAGSIDGLTIELMALFPLVLVGIVWRAFAGHGLFGLSDLGLDIWLVGAGAMTIAPLLLFSAFARRVELWIVGMLQYLAPTIQFLLAVLLWDETWSRGQAIGFILIWIALAIFAGNTLLQVRRVRRLQPAGLPTTTPMPLKPPPASP